MSLVTIATGYSPARALPNTTPITPADTLTSLATYPPPHHSFMAAAAAAVQNTSKHATGPAPPTWSPDTGLFTGKRILNETTKHCDSKCS